MAVCYSWFTPAVAGRSASSLLATPALRTAESEITMPRRANLIPVERKDIPEFKTESEEAKFWATHDLGPGLEAEMRPDFDPNLPPPDEVRTHLVERQRDRSERTQPVPIRFDADVLTRLRALAARKHTGYQTLLKTFVTERLYEEEKREGLV
jgi:hypothetical protein